MTDKIKESISALIDEELSEIEVHRLLRQYADDPSIKESWFSYQQVRAVSQGERGLTVSRQIELHGRISAAIDAEDDIGKDFKSGIGKSGNWYKPAAGMAIAACLVVAVFVGVNTSQQASSPDIVEATSPGFKQQPVDVQTVSSTTNATTNATPNATPNAMTATQQFVAEIPFEDKQLELRELDEESQDRLRQYLMQHDRLGRMNSNLQTVTFKSKAGKN